ncbi:thioredoxin fold domain-containing protein [Jeotgalibaca ciconiae]|uniref:Thiol reductase thioredoxin n=1 Tax=Jeotgalibaca ciconiae TaxID=2496265 RepID=A0A3Q9BJW5_9LACT|nr:thioredoxin fold domain-containing protein [Jeotgalibaca ciconiae]AZP04090.1 thiol reductase thioredoxin [Jeotgalibaca ciconiae]HJB22875.1 conjugal transfer protein TraF [Candidatus Jeotgalibaca pullicola]
MSQEQYEEVVSNFIEITAQDVENRLAKGEKTILFIGKPTCPYCQKFVPKLDNVREQNNLTIHYLNSLNTPTDAEIKALRDKMEVPLVPQVVTIDGENAFTNLKIDSSASEETLAELLAE